MIFKNQYYYFIAGLPDFSFDSTKLPFTTETFRTMLDEELKSDDKRLIDKYFIRYDNENLLRFLKDREASLNELGNLSGSDFSEIVKQIKEDETIKNKRIPPFYEQFIASWLNEENHDGATLWEDKLASLYLDYGAEVKNTLIARWFDLNANIANVLAAIYGKKYGLDVAEVVVGNNRVAQIIRNNPNVRDFGLSLELEYFDALVRLSEEKDIYERERKLDRFRWDWLDENTVFDYFNIEYIFSYLCKLQILERWVSLNAEEGERVFRELIQSLKGEVNLPKE